MLKTTTLILDDAIQDRLECYRKLYTDQSGFKVSQQAAIAACLKVGLDRAIELLGPTKKRRGTA